MKAVVVVYMSRDAGIEVERATADEAEACQWVAENPLHEHDDGVYELWEAEPGSRPTKLRSIWPAESIEMHHKVLNPG